MENLQLQQFHDTSSHLHTQVGSCRCSVSVSHSVCEARDYCSSEMHVSELEILKTIKLLRAFRARDDFVMDKMMLKD